MSSVTKKLRTAFTAIGSAVGTFSQFHDGSQGKSMDWRDTGPQAFPKLAGRLIYSHNAFKKIEGNWAVAERSAKLSLETPPFTTNYPSRPFIKL